MKTFFKILVNIYFKLFYRVKVINKEKLPKDGSYLLCANHFHAKDPFLISTILRRQIRIIAKAELFENKFVGKLITLAGAYSVGKNEGDLSAIRTTLKHLKDGIPVLLFPEGTRNYTSAPLPAKPGLIMMAMRAKVKIVPIAVFATNINYKIFTKFIIEVLDPIDLSEYYDKTKSVELYQKLSQEIVDDIYNNVDRIKNKYYENKNSR